MSVDVAPSQSGENMVLSGMSGPKEEHGLERNIWTKGRGNYRKVGNTA